MTLPPSKLRNALPLQPEATLLVGLRRIAINPLPAYLCHPLLDALSVELTVAGVEQVLWVIVP